MDADETIQVMRRENLIDRESQRAREREGREREI